MKKLILLFAFASIGFTMHAQTNQEEESAPDDTTAFVDSVYKDVYRYTDTCLPSNGSLTPIVVRFENSANIYLKSTEGFTNQTLRIYNEKTPERIISRLVFNKNNPYLENFPLNETFLIKGTNRCGEDYIIARFNTNDKIVEDNEELQLTLSEEISELMENSLERRKNIFDFYDELNDNENITYYEKLNFAQDYLLRGKRIPDNYKIPISKINNEVFISNKFFFIDRDFIAGLWPKKECVCVIAQSSASTTAPYAGELTFDGTRVYPSYTNEVERIEESNHRHQWRAWSRSYAARYEQIWQEFTIKADPRELNYNDLGTDDEGNSNLPKYFAGIEYAYNCFDKYGNRSDNCGCKKNVDIDYSYYADTYVGLKDIKGTSEVSNLAKDVAIISIDNQIDDPLFDYKLLGVSGTYKQTINPAVILEGVKPLVKGIFELTTKGAASTTTAIDNFAESATGFINASKNWKTTDSFKYNKQNGGILLLGNKTVKLYPNKKVKVRLFSASHLVGKGKGKFKTTAKTTSFYTLSTYIPYEFHPDDNSGCNNKGFAAWNSATVLGNESSIKNQINSFYLLNSFTGYNNNMVGALDDVSAGIPGANPFKGIRNNLTESPISLEFPISYTILGMNGRTFGKGVLKSNANENYRQIIQKKLINASKGVYIIRIIDSKNQTTSIKLLN